MMFEQRNLNKHLTASIDEEFRGSLLRPRVGGLFARQCYLELFGALNRAPMMRIQNSAIEEIYLEEELAAKAKLEVLTSKLIS